MPPGVCTIRAIRQRVVFGTIERDDRTTLRGERETFGFPIQIAARIKKRGDAATHREIIEPRNRNGFVTEQIQVTMGTYFEITGVSAGFGKGLVGTPDCESNELVVPFF
jgi:hypothetical protein